MGDTTRVTQHYKTHACPKNKKQPQKGHQCIHHARPSPVVLRVSYIHTYLVLLAHCVELCQHPGLSLWVLAQLSNTAWEGKARRRGWKGAEGSGGAQEVCVETRSVCMLVQVRSARLARLPIKPVVQSVRFLPSPGQPAAPHPPRQQPLS